MKDIIIKYLQSEYSRYSHFLQTYSDHVEKLHDMYVLNITERNQYLRLLNDISKNLNNIYNNNLKKLKTDISNIDLLDDSNSENISDTKTKSDNLLVKNSSAIVIDLLSSSNLMETMTLENLWKTIDVEYIKNAYFSDFETINKTKLDYDEIKDKLLKISSKIGFYSLEQAMNLLYKSNFKDLFETKKNFYEMFQLYNSMFIPLSYNITTNESTFPSKFSISSKYIDSEHEVILDHYAEVTIMLSTSQISFKGFFRNEPLNIILKTSQICKKTLFTIRKQLIDSIGTKDIFKNAYVKNMSIGEVLSSANNMNYFINIKLNEEKDKYLKYSKMSFRHIMNEEFLSDKTTVQNQYKIIRLLLEGGSEENNKMAGLLFGLTKEKKMGIHNTELIANIIYRTLNFNLQSKLRKTSMSIKTEFDKIKNLSTEDIDINKQIILCKNMPLYIKKITTEKALEMKNGGSEYYKQKTYVDILLNFPWPNTDKKNPDMDIFQTLNKNKKDSVIFLDTVKDTLDKKVYGHEECKSTIKQLIGKWISNPASLGRSIGLFGPAGVGKTLLAKSLGEAIQIPFTQINLGGMEDRCILSGHSYTYSAAQPGLIVRKMVESGKPRCIMYFDELDKACAKHGINEIFNVLIHLTDKNTNDKFTDSFFSEITFPLDQVLFVFSYNDPEKVDRILLDRMEKIEVKPYTLNDKLVIVKKFMLQEICEEIGINRDSITISDTDIEYIIENFTLEAGVRELKRKLESIFLKLNLDKIYSTNLFKTHEKQKVITREIIDKYLTKPNNLTKKIHEQDCVGIINGLFATTAGYGGIIPIIIYHNYTGKKDELTLKITGSQGEVMKESVEFAYNTAMEIIKPLYREKFLRECIYGLHIHTPDGATPKDGPSAGSAFTTGFISKIINKKIKHDIAMTGEIDLNGKLSAIGGLPYKIKGAQKAGINTIYIPKENSKDLDEILKKDTSLTAIKIIPVEHIKDILKDVLIFDPSDPNDNIDKYIY
jgi:endopeptidase La